MNPDRGYRQTKVRNFLDTTCLAFLLPNLAGSVQKHTLTIVDPSEYHAPYCAIHYPRA